jgi:hypothetical protein
LAHAPQTISSLPAAAVVAAQYLQVTHMQAVVAEPADLEHQPVSLYRQHLQ